MSQHHGLWVGRSFWKDLDEQVVVEGQESALSRPARSSHQLACFTNVLVRSMRQNNSDEYGAESVPLELFVVGGGGGGGVGRNSWEEQSKFPLPGKKMGRLNGVGASNDKTFTTSEKCR